VEFLHGAADVLVNFVHASVGCREELLLGSRALIRVAIECGVRRGAAVMLTMAQAATDVEFQDMKGFPMGEGLGHYEDLLKGFEPAANVVAVLVPADQVLNEDPQVLLRIYPFPRCKRKLYLKLCSSNRCHAYITSLSFLVLPCFDWQWWPARPPRLHSLGEPKGF
jgi:hypothetical protein